jgi:exodeoxyribonuclease VII small subunit
MSKSAKGTNPANPADADVPFDEALKKLETIVESMEAGDLALESMLTRFEEGTRLSRLCQAKLAEAEIKIQQLEKDAAGNLTLKPLTLPESSASE